MYGQTRAHCPGLTRPGSEKHSAIAQTLIKAAAAAVIIWQSGLNFTAEFSWRITD